MKTNMKILYRKNAIQNLVLFFQDKYSKIKLSCRFYQENLIESAPKFPNIGFFSFFLRQQMKSF